MVTVSGVVVWRWGSGRVVVVGGGVEPVVCRMLPNGLPLDMFPFAVSSSFLSDAQLESGGFPPSCRRFGLTEFRQAAAVSLRDLPSTTGGWTRRSPAEWGLVFGQCLQLWP